VTQLEFWPDYGAGALWTQEGRPLAVEALGVPAGLAEQLHAWNGLYSESQPP
jgi:hypothetical protein